VTLEDQMLKMTDARMNYDAAVSFYQKSMADAEDVHASAGRLRGTTR
jgi:flagellar basal body rod protein FlgB